MASFALRQPSRSGYSDKSLDGRPVAMVTTTLQRAAMLTENIAAQLILAAVVGRFSVSFQKSPVSVQQRGGPACADVGKVAFEPFRVDDGSCLKRG